MDTRARALLGWLSTCGKGRADSLADLCDGALLCDVVSGICPDEITASLVRRDIPEGQWFLRAHNLKKYHKAVLSFLHGRHSTSFPELENVSLDDVAKQIGDWVRGASSLCGPLQERDMISLVRLLLCAALLSDEKQKYIQGIMTLEADMKRELMVVIKKHEMMKTTVTAPPPSPVIGRAAAVPSTAAGTAAAADADLAGKLADVTEKLLRMTREKEHWESAYDELRRDLDIAVEGKRKAEAEFESLSSHTKSLEKDLEALNLELSQLARKEEHSAAAKAQDSAATKAMFAEEVLQQELEEKEESIRRLHRKVEELTPYVREAKELRDQVDILTQRMEMADRDRERVKVFEAKLEALPAMRERVEAAERTADEFLKKNVSLEDEVKRLKAAKSQLSDARAQLAQQSARMIVLEGERETALQQQQSAQQQLAGLQQQVRELRAQQTSRELVRPSPIAASGQGESLESLSESHDAVPPQVYVHDEDEITQLQTKNELLTSRIKELEERHSDTDSTSEEHRLQIESLQRELKKALEKAAVSTGDGVDATERDAWLQQKSALEQELALVKAGYEEDLNALRVEVEASNDCITQERSRNDALRAELENARKQTEQPESMVPPQQQLSQSSARDNEDVAKRLEQTELEMKLLLSALQQSGVQVMKGAIQGRPKHDTSEMFTASR